MNATSVLNLLYCNLQGLLPIVNISIQPLGKYNGKKKHPELKITNIIFKLQDGQCSTMFITNYSVWDINKFKYDKRWKI